MTLIRNTPEGISKLLRRVIFLLKTDRVRERDRFFQVIYRLTLFLTGIPTLK